MMSETKPHAIMQADIPAKKPSGYVHFEPLPALAMCEVQIIELGDEELRRQTARQRRL